MEKTGSLWDVGDAAAVPQLTLTPLISRGEAYFTMNFLPFFTTMPL